MPEEIFAYLAVLQEAFARDVRQELVQSPAAIDVHELRSQADAEGGQSAFFDFGQESQFEFLASGIDGDGFGMARLAEDRRVKIIAAGEEDSVQEIDVLGDQRQIGLIREQEGQAAGEFDGLGVVDGRFVSAGLVVLIDGDADHGAGHLMPRRIPPVFCDRRACARFR